MISTFSLIQTFVLAVIAGVCTYLFLTIKRDIRVLGTGCLRGREDLRAKLGEVTEELETVRRELEMMEQRSDPAATVARTLGPGARIQALRMIKLGEGPEHIAAALSLPRTEVELLMKVQRLLADQQPRPTSVS